MVKRPKSPEVIEEARYFTVCQPFPLNANWLFDKDQQDCATWIAECIGLEHLYAIHYKPSARSMILLEVSKMFANHECLLGEHRWSEMLKDSEIDSEEINRVSQVFHSFYSTGREAQKDGWKNLVVKSTWFKNWSPGKGRFKKPYPPTHWCHVPVEDKTNKQLCRPLPASRMPPPPRVEQPVVGSSTWAQTKIAGNPTPETLTKAWDEDVSSIDIVSKLIIEPVQPKPNGYSVPVLIPTTTSASTATSAPKESQPNSSFFSSHKNKKNKPIPLNQFIDRRGSNKPSPTWNKPAATPSASLSPAASSPLDDPSIKPTPRSANAWDKPIKLPVSPVPAKKEEAPAENFSSWGKEAATSTVDQETIWKSPPPTKKKSRKKKGGPAIPEASVSSTSPKSTQPPTPRVSTAPSISSTAPDIRHLDFRPSAWSEEEDSDCDDIYVPLSKVKYNDISPEELERGHISAWEGGAADGVEPDASEAAGPGNEDRVYGNLWLSEEDPRAIPLPELICPTHQIACSKGICQDMSKLLRAKKLKEEQAKREKEGKNKKSKDKRKKESGDDNKTEEGSNTVEVDGDNFTIARSTVKRRGFGKQKKAQDTPEVGESSHIGRMRAFPADPPPDGEAKPEPERELFTQW